jgi:hypothetical protein
MIGRWVVGVAVVVYLAIAGAALLSGRGSDAVAAAESAAPTASPGSPGPTISLAGLPYRGAGMQIQRVDWMDKYKASVDEMAAIGLDTVSFVVDSRMENGTTAKIYLDMRMTPTPEHLADLIGHAKRKGMRVILMPIVLLDKPRGTEWRGRINPATDNGGWETWWESYRAMMHHFAWVAQLNGVDVLSVGSELVSTETPDKLNEWHRLIRDVREVYKGQLTYSANWDHYTHVRFWDKLDLIGMNSYYKLGDDRHVTVDEIKRRWGDIQKDLLAFTRKQNKPLLFLEVGWCSLANAAHEPWDYTQTDEPLDEDLQKRLYEGFFQTWHGNPNLGGFMVWEWTPGQPEENDKGYTPEGKPAEQVLKQWLAKPRWDVKVQ